MIFLEVIQNWEEVATDLNFVVDFARVEFLGDSILNVDLNIDELFWKIFSELILNIDVTCLNLVVDLALVEL